MSFKDDIAQNLWGLFSANFQFSTQNLSFYCKLMSIFQRNKNHSLSPSQNTKILLEMFLIVYENSIHIKNFLSHFNLKKKKQYWFYLSLIMTAHSSELLRLPRWWPSSLRRFPLRFSIYTALLLLCFYFVLTLSSPIP